MANERFDTIGKCDFCGKKQATVMFTRKNFIRSCTRFLCEDCIIHFKRFNDSLNRRVG